MSLLDELRKKLGKLYNIEELCLLAYNERLRCFRICYQHTPYDNGFKTLTGAIDFKTANNFIDYAMQLLIANNYTAWEMNEVFIAWLNVNELDI